MSGQRLIVVATLWLRTDHMRFDRHSALQSDRGAGRRWPGVPPATPDVADPSVLGDQLGDRARERPVTLAR